MSGSLPSDLNRSGSASTASDAKSRWRQILGHYPTGITIVTSVDGAKKPVGMIVGTFTSVSEEPPLVGFLPQRSARTLAHIERSGRFRASVLGAGHERLCREFFGSPQDRFQGDEWEYDEHGIARLRDAVAWFDASVHDVLPAGDHMMVLGLVEDLGLGPRAGGVPLVFLNGGYGTFTDPRQELELTDLGGRLRVANRVGNTVEQLAMQVGVQCCLSTVLRDEVVVLTAADVRSSYVGTSFPFAAPMDPGFAAWCRPDARQAWIERGHELTGGIDVALVDDIVRLVRESGYAVSFGHTMGERFSNIQESGGSASGDLLGGMWRELVAAYVAYRHDPRPERHATAIQVPIFGHDGFVAYELLVSGFELRSDPDRFSDIVATAMRYGEQITRMIGGRTPAQYQARDGVRSPDRLERFDITT